jgi:hypothetical protein
VALILLPASASPLRPISDGQGYRPGQNETSVGKPPLLCAGFSKTRRGLQPTPSRMATMDDLERMLAKMLKDVGRLPPGQDRYEMLKDIGRLEVKLDAFKNRKKSQPAK